MADTRTSKNPLTGLAVVFAIFMAYDVYRVWTTVDLFSAATMLQTIGFLILYFKKSRYAVKYLLCSILPVYAL